MKLSYTKVRRILIGFMLVYIFAQATYVYYSLGNYNRRINNIRMVNNTILESLTDINRQLLHANKQYYDFVLDRGGDLTVIVEIMTSTIKQCKALKQYIVDNNIDFDIQDIDSLLSNAKLLKMIAYSYNKSWKRTRTGGTTVEMDEALRLATDKPIWASLDLVSKIREHVEAKTQDVISSLTKQKNTFVIILSVQVLALILLVIALEKLLKWHIKRLLLMADSISDGIFDARVEVVGNDILGGLASALNNTAAHLAVLHSNLAKEKEKAELANESKTKFLSNISHEIRTPLNSISGFSELALAADKLDESKNNTSYVLSESEHLLRLINTILDHAKIEAGKLKLEKVPFNLHHELNQFSAMITPLIKDKNINFLLNIDEQLPKYIISDSLRLSQIIRNLLSNSAKFTESGVIKLDVKLIANRGNYAQIGFTVSDTGIGIPEDKIKTIFEGFTQVDESVTRKYGGTGLGTTITKELVELFGSYLDVRSVEGVGTTFRFGIDFELPSEEQVQELDAQSKNAVDKVNRIQNKDLDVLVVDDYVLNQTLLKSFLQIEGLDCELADNGQIAVDMCRDKEYSIIFMDVQMPVMNGHQAVKLIRAKSKCNKSFIIGISADASVQARQKCLESGFDTVLNKPIKRVDFINLISSFKK